MWWMWLFLEKNGDDDNYDAGTDREDNDAREVDNNGNNNNEEK